MTFEQAGAEFARIRLEWQSGRMSPAEFQQRAAQLRVQDPAGRWWQVEPASGAWMYWNGSAWTSSTPAPSAPAPAQATYPAQQPYAAQASYPVQQPYAAQAPHPAYPQAPYPPQSQAPWPAQTPAPKPATRPAGPGIMEGLMTMAPGILVELLQRGSFYKTNPAAAVNFVVPALLPPVAMALAVHVGRVVATLVILGCMAWLAWPFLSGGGQNPAAQGPAMHHAGRGLVGMSMLYMIPRIWGARR